MKSLRLRRGLVVFPLLVACGGAPPAKTADSVETPVANPKADLSPVAAPEGFFGWVRASDPDKTMTTAFGYVGFPAPGAEVLAEQLGEPVLAKVIDVHAPMEAASFLHIGGRGRPDAKVVVSAGLRSLAEAKRDLAKWTIGEEKGVTLVSFDAAGETRTATDEDDAFGPSETSAKACALAPAAGPAKARIVCGEKASLLGFVPFMTRTLPLREAPEALYAELLMKPLRAPAKDLGKMAQSMVPVLLDDPSVARLGQVLVSMANDVVDFSQDADIFSLKLRLAPEGAKLVFGAQFEGNTATMTKLMVNHPERAQSKPEGLAKLPDDAQAFSFTQGVDLDPLRNGLKQLLDALTDLAASAKFPEAERKRIDELVERTMKISGHATSTAIGYDADAIKKAVDAYGRVPEAQRGKARYAVLGALDGWRVYRVRGVSASEVATLVTDWGKLLESKGWRSWVTSLAKGKDAKDRNRVTKQVEAALKVLTVKVKASKAKAGLGLPAGTEQVDFTVPRFSAALHDLTEANAAARDGKTKPAAVKSTPVTYTLLFSPDGDGLVNATATDAKVAVAKLKETLSKTASSRKEVKRLEDARANAGAYVSMSAIGNTLLASLLASEGRAEKLLGRVTRLPADKGAYVTWRALAPNANAKAGSFELETELPAETLVALIPLVR